MSTLPLTYRYVGGSLDGLTRLAHEDQVPSHIAIAIMKSYKSDTWEHYNATDRVYDDGLLVEVTYAFTHED